MSIMMADMVSGARICVTVESVFSEGIVVSFTEKNGQEYRGALLAHTDGEACKMCSTSRSFLANPLTLLHDHPYSKLKNYAKRLANAIPSEILTDWNVNSFHMKQNMSGNGLTTPTPLSSRQSSPSSIELPVESSNDKSTIVEVTVDDPVSFPEVTNDQLFGTQMVGGFGRKAKSRAKFNIKATLDELNDLRGLSGRMDTKVSQRRPAVRSTSLEPVQHKSYRGRKEQSAGLSALSTTNQFSVRTPTTAATVAGDSATTIDVSTSSNESYHSLPLPSPPPRPLPVTNLKYPQLRDFSIDLHKVPAVRKCVAPKGNTSKGNTPTGKPIAAAAFEIAEALCPDIGSEEDIGPHYVVIDLTESDDDDFM